MQTRYDVSVTVADIESATTNDSARCAVATAVARAIPEATTFMVDVQTIRFSLPRERKRLMYLTPHRVQEYIVAFDAGDEIPPFKFQLRDPAYEVPMRPHRGQPTGDSETLVRNSKGEIMRRKGIQPPRNSIRASRSRAYGQRVMRVNQQFPGKRD